MKIKTSVLCAVILFLGFSRGEAQVVERGPGYTRIKPPANENPKAPRPQGGYTKLGTGLNRLSDGVWVSSEPMIDVVANGVLASGAPHTLLLAPNINTEGGVQVTDSAGNVIRSHVYGIALYDPTTEETLLIAELQDSFAEIVEPNEIWYRQVSQDIDADLRYSYSKYGIEQDFILKSRIVPEAFGFRSETVQLLVLTEIVTKPQLKKLQLPGGTNEMARAVGVNLIDERLMLGNMHLGMGRAFLSHANPANGELPALRNREGAPVGKSRLQAEQREFLVEAVNFADIAAELENLPEGKPVAQVPGKKKKLSTLIAKQIPHQPGKAKQIIVASVPKKEPGVVIDYALLSSSADVVLKGDTTYYVSSPLIVTNLTIEPGTVVKYSTNGSITVKGGVYCPGNDYLPSIFTSKDDNTVGETISGSTGNPSGYYANPALLIENNFSELRNIRIHNAKEGINYGPNSFGPFLGAFAPHALWHSEIVECEKAIVVNKEAKLRNVLLYNNATNFHKTSASAVTAHGEHVTVHHGSVMNNSGNLTLKLTNSLIVSITTPGSYSGLSNVFLSSDFGVFKKVGAGEHYLADSSPYRDAGTTNIHRVLRDNLAKRTTYGPIVFQDTLISEPLVLDRETQRDILLPDLGWHPPALDYLVKDLIVTNGGSLNLTNGVAVGTFGTNGFKVHSSIYFYGSPTEPSILTRYYCAQESRTNSLGSYSPTNHSALISAFGVIEMNYASLTANANGGKHMSGPFFSVLDVKNSELRGSEILINDAGSDVAIFQNNIFDQCDIYLSGENLHATLYNNLVKESELTLYSWSGLTAAWPVKDNLFDRSVLTVSDYEVDAEYNGYYLTDTNSIYGDLGGNNVNLASLFYEKGPLGDFYFPVQNALFQTGSRTADLAGLYHHTTRFDQTKATNGQVSIGRHYVSTDTAGYDVVAWVDDGIPAGASPYGDESWIWTNSPAPFAGSSNHKSGNTAGAHQHYFEYATATLPIYEGDNLFCYFYGGGSSAASEVMLQWKTTAWNHRAYWGSDLVGWMPSAHRGLMVPTTNLWHRLEVPASTLNVEGTSFTGMAFTLYNGTGNWDYAGVLRYTGPPLLYDSDGDGLPDYAEDLDGDGAADSGETDWESYNSMYGAGSGAGLQTFTPLQ